MKPLKRSGMDHTVYLQITPRLFYLVRVHQMALPLTCDGVRLIAAYYSSFRGR